MLENDYIKRLALAKKAANKIGRLLLENFNKNKKISRKKDGSLVTAIDVKAEKLAVKLIKQAFPLDGILAEEGGNSSSKNGFVWIIDPIDGTHNYIRGIDIFGTSIAVQYKGKIVVGLIYMPCAKEMYTAIKGQGAFLNGKRIKVSNNKLRASTMVYDSTISMNKKKMLESLDVISGRVFNIRMLGSTARSLSYVAEGKADLEVEFNDKLWDFAAGLLLVEEAGGKFTDFNNSKKVRATQAYVASNGKIHSQVLKLLNK
jgi:myo-inositol-1(or 4)-monophosphatase